MKFLPIIIFASGLSFAQVPSANQQDIYKIIDEVSADRIESDVRR